MYLLCKCNNLFVMNSVQLSFPTLYSLMLSKSLTSLSRNFLVFFSILTVVSSDILISADDDSVPSDTQSYLKMAVTIPVSRINHIRRCEKVTCVKAGWAAIWDETWILLFIVYILRILWSVVWLYTRVSCNSFRICLIHIWLFLIWLRIYWY